MTDERRYGVIEVDGVGPSGNNNPHQQRGSRSSPIIALAELFPKCFSVFQGRRFSPNNAGWKTDLAWFNNQIAALTK